MHKQFRGSRAPWGGGSAWEVSVEILNVYAFFGFLRYSGVLWKGHCHAWQEA